MAIGNRVFLKREMPDQAIIEGFKLIPAANVCDCMNRVYALNPEIKLMSSPTGEIMAGVALTVKVRPGDNLMIHQALEMAGEGDVIIVSNEGDRSRALVGEIIVAYAQYTKKISGLVFDGPIRDVDAISKMEIPVYATGSTPGGPFKEGPGEVNVPIAIGGVSVNPGDIILGDKDGLVVIPRCDAHELLEEAMILSDSDSSKVEAAKNGTSNKKWVAEKLSDKDCKIIDDYYKY
ncbi:RraA family protein [Acidaminobacter hydrogenoformans]|uniref:Putative 4-hydroxy-4-methyl-2-oxoglutarate aldolase n=1 Tax=Acidaminobacter hydrogenoformans DSM 2784 TaxID=1120920 RepID=A0A1G5S018_9FIRM|nr:RraA family protein [Acidaminobacter hydrogenoformans]SCZ79507.1 RraA famliy [Acidaminobacter hydrogenoformans DSM 2784]